MPIPGTRRSKAFRHRRLRVAGEIAGGDSLRTPAEQVLEQPPAAAPSALAGFSLGKPRAAVEFQQLQRLSPARPALNAVLPVPCQRWITPG